MTDLIHVEPMAPHMTKYHIAGPCVLHRFTAPDHGDFHTHPWSFTSTILTGGYVEEVLTVLAPDDWRVHCETRRPGDTFRIQAAHAHRIVDLLDGECWTAIEPGPTERKSGFWRVVDGVMIWRGWDE